MKYLVLMYIVVGGLAFVVGKEEAQLVAVGAPAEWVALVKGTVSDIVGYIGLLGAGGIIALPLLPQSVKNAFGSQPEANGKGN